jgi:hypothetical protein
MIAFFSLLSSLHGTYISLKDTTGLEPISYRGALLSTLLHATVYVRHNLLNVLVQAANKMGLKNISLQLVDVT